MLISYMTFQPLGRFSDSIFPIRPCLNQSEEPITSLYLHLSIAYEEMNETCELVSDPIGTVPSGKELLNWLGSFSVHKNCPRSMAEVARPSPGPLAKCPHQSPRSASWG